MATAGAGLVVLSLIYAIWIMLIPPTVCLLAIVVNRCGLLTTVVATALAMVAVSAAVSRYVAAAAVTNQLALIVLTVAGGLSLLQARKVAPSIRVPAVAFLALSAIWAFVSLQTSGVYGARGFLALTLPLFAVLAAAGACALAGTASGPPRQPGTKVIGAVLATAVVINIVLGLKQAIFGLTGAEISAARSGDSTYLVGEQIRLMGAFRTNQDLAVFLTFFAPACVVLSVKSTGRARWLYGFGGGALYSVAFLSLTRTALVAGVPVGLIGLFIALRGDAVRKVAKVLGIVAVVGTASAAVVSQLRIARVNDAIDRMSTILDLGDDSSFNARLSATLPESWRLFWSNPLGLGAGSAGPISQQFPATAPRGVITPDNGYLVIGIQIGVLGLLAFATMLVGLTIFLIRSSSGTAVAAGVGLMSLLCAMMLAGYWSLGAPMALAAAFVGFAIVERERSLPRTDNPVDDRSAAFTATRL